MAGQACLVIIDVESAVGLEVDVVTDAVYVLDVYLLLLTYLP